MKKMNTIMKHAVAMGILVQAVSSMEPEYKDITENGVSFEDEMFSYDSINADDGFTSEFIDDEDKYDFFDPLALNANFYQNFMDTPENFHNNEMSLSPWCFFGDFGDNGFGNPYFPAQQHNTFITEQPCLKRKFTDEVSSDEATEPKNKKHNATIEGKAEVTDWEILPAEIQNEILFYCEGKLNTTSLVCTKWKEISDKVTLSCRFNAFLSQFLENA